MSRRAILSSLATLFVLASAANPVEGSDADAPLIALGRECDSSVAQIDHALESGADIAQDVLDQFARIEAKIIATPTTTIDGLRVKARAACWALLGDLDAADQSTTDKRMMVSILRDLIRLYDPHLERPGAINELVARATA